jgi:hypothetical protein
MQSHSFTLTHPSPYGLISLNSLFKSKKGAIGVLRNNTWNIILNIVETLGPSTVTMNTLNCTFNSKEK